MRNKEQLYALVDGRYAADGHTEEQKRGLQAVKDLIDRKDVGAEAFGAMASIIAASVSLSPFLALGFTELVEVHKQGQDEFIFKRTAA